jgi:small subunit ribosomal protein S13
MPLNKTFFEFIKLTRMPGVKSKIKNQFKQIAGLNLRNNAENLKAKSFLKAKRFLKFKNLVGKELISRTKENMDFLSKIKTYKGIRNKFGYPSRGQRTHTNGKTKKKLQKKKQL